MIKIILLISFFLGFAKVADAQLRIDTSRSVEYMVRTVLVGKEGDFKIDNIEYRGSKKSIGVFNCPMAYNKMMLRGIILSTGDVFDAIGPNNSPNTGSTTVINDDNDLSALANGKTFDAVILEFDFIPNNDSICFNFFFASEEYPEFVKKNVNDVFGFFLSCKELNSEQNLAVVEDNIPITVDNINATTNNKYFIENSVWNHANTEKWKNDKQRGELALLFQFDGLTVPLNAGTIVVPQKKYHIKLAISDVGDRLYDSAIFLEAGAFKSTATKKNIPFDQLVKEEFGDILVTDLNNAVSINLNINFETDSFKVSGKESFELLEKIFTLLGKDSSMSVEINGHTDDSGTKEYNKILSLNRAKNIADYLLAKGIESERVTYKGYGDLKPISVNDKALNRRVEFVFIKKASED